VEAKLGVGFGADGLDIRIDGRMGCGVLELSRLFPVQVLGPGVHDLIEGPPGVRRRFLDWGVFHVEHRYLECWRRYRRVLGQRNAALRSGGGSAGPGLWDEPFLSAAIDVHEARSAYAERLAERCGSLGAQLLDRKLDLSYRPGWRNGLTLPEALTQSSEAEKRLGVTQVGPHRADFSLSMDEGAVRERASRGQQKLIAAALVLAQSELAGEVYPAGGALLVDDPAAELDGEALAKLLATLDGVKGQLWLTGLSEAQLPPEPGYPVFHVEQGNVRPVL
jgi:DNA replication and repair protein RecF